MSRTRDEVYTMLTELLGSDNVYFNPPEGFKLQYPCILIAYKEPFYRLADNVHYTKMDLYDVTYIFKSDADYDLMHKLMETKGFAYDRFYRSDGLNHVAYTLRID